MADPRIPVIVFGDGPMLPSGLGRIARDLTARLYVEADQLGIRVIQVGVAPPTGWHWQGGWEFYGFQPSEQDQGRGALGQVLDSLLTETEIRPIVLVVNDPSRCYDLIRIQHLYGADDLLPAEFWGYFPIDGHNVQQAIGGPAGEAVRSVDRVLAYGRYGAEVLKQTLSLPTTTFRTPQVQALQAVEAAKLAATVQYLPHGLDLSTWTPGVPLEAADPLFQDWISHNSQAVILGAVATNQPRKDLGLLFAGVAELRTQGYQSVLWLHTDLLTKSWDVGQLAHDFRLPRHSILVSTDELPDRQLAARYCASDITIAPGLGEGFGYPICESLACGTPCVAINYAGGAELIPDPQWLVEPAAWRLESCYAIQRPVIAPLALANTILRAWESIDDTTPAYCAGSVAHLGWQSLWPRWRSWIHTGLEARRGQ